MPLQLVRPDLRALRQGPQLRPNTRTRLDMPRFTLPSFSGVNRGHSAGDHCPATLGPKGGPSEQSDDRAVGHICSPALTPCECPPDARFREGMGPNAGVAGLSEREERRKTRSFWSGHFFGPTTKSGQYLFAFFFFFYHSAVSCGDKARSFEHHWGLKPPVNRTVTRSRAD